MDLSYTFFGLCDRNYETNYEILDYDGAIVH